MPLPKMSAEARRGLELANAERALIEGLAKVREEKHMTAADVAEKIGRHKSAISRFESLEGNPRLSTVFRYALAVGARVSIKVDAAPTWDTADSLNLTNKRITFSNRTGTWVNSQQNALACDA